MAKKKARSSSSPPPQENRASEEQKPGHEIEEIFKKKRKKPERTDLTLGDLNTEEENLKKNKKEKKIDEKPKKKNKASLKGGFQNDPMPRPRRKTQDGLTIYSAEELGVGNSDAGGTPLCPFDCSCCF